MDLFKMVPSWSPPFQMKFGLTHGPIKYHSYRLSVFQNPTLRGSNFLLNGPNPNPSPTEWCLRIKRTIQGALLGALFAVSLPLRSDTILFFRTIVPLNWLTTIHKVLYCHEEKGNLENSDVSASCPIRNVTAFCSLFCTTCQNRPA